MKLNHLFFLAGILLLASCKEPQARRPITQSTTNIYEAAAKENKRLNDIENKEIESYIAKDSIQKYHVSTKGFWYVYNQKTADANSETPKVGDIVTIEYDIRDLNNSTIYTKEELGNKTYKIDKEDFIPALQDGLKLMKKGETITFVIPSYRAYGISGDGNKIGINQTLKSTVTLIDIKSNLDESK